MTSHREAPKISKDPVADNTDLYAFVSPDKPDTATILTTFNTEVYGPSKCSHQYFERWLDRVRWPEGRSVLRGSWIDLRPRHSKTGSRFSSSQDRNHCG